MKNKSIALAVAEAFELNPSVNEFHVTIDGQCFANKNDAINHAKMLDVKTVEVFKRDQDEDEDQDLDDDVKPLDAKSLIALVNEANDEDALLELLAGDKRSTVVAAGKKRLAWLKEQAASKQALEADEAIRERMAANPGGQDESTSGAGDHSENQI